MWEQLLAWLGNGGNPEAIAGTLAATADPGGMLSVLSPEAMSAGATGLAQVQGVSPPMFGPNPNSVISPNIGTGLPIMDGAVPTLGDILLTQPQRAVPIPQVPNPPSYGPVTNGPMIPASTTDKLAFPDPKQTRPTMGLTPEQALAMQRMMTSGQEQQQRMPPAPAVQGQAARPPGAVSFGGVTPYQRPPSLGQLIYGRR